MRNILSFMPHILYQMMFLSQHKEHAQQQDLAPADPFSM